MNVLIFGGTGLLGSAAAQILLTVVIRLKLLLCLRFLKVHLFLRKWILNSVTSLNLLMKNLKKL